MRICGIDPFMFRLAAIAILLLTATGCAQKKPVEKADVIGIFRANFSTGTNILELRADGTYKHLLHEHGKTLIEHTNRWEFEHWKGKPWLNFYEFTGDARTKPGSPGALWGVEIERNGNGLRLSWDSDVNHYFSKDSE
jgi:hypothetical protein